jgi:hypothetical protein
MRVDVLVNLMRLKWKRTIKFNLFQGGEGLKTKRDFGDDNNSTRKAVN